MSVSMTWQPHETKRGKHFNGGSTLHGILENAYSSFPIVLSMDNVEFLKGLQACGYDGAGELINAIYEYEVIKIEAEW